MKTVTTNSIMNQLNCIIIIVLIINYSLSHYYKSDDSFEMIIKHMPHHTGVPRAPAVVMVIKQ